MARHFLVALLTIATLHFTGKAEDSAQRKDEIWQKIKPLFQVPDEFKDKLAPHCSLLKMDDGSVVTNAADWKRRREELLKYWHTVMGAWPAAIEKPRVEFLEKEDVKDFTRHKIKLEVAPERSVVAYLLVPPGKGPFPAILDVFYQPLDGAGLTTTKTYYHDFGATMAKRGFVALCVGLEPRKTHGDIYFPSVEAATLQPLSYNAYVSGNCRRALANMPEVDAKRIGVVGHSYGGKWAMFSGALNEEFAAVAISDPGIVFDEPRGNVNYWEPWYLGYDDKPFRKHGLLTPEDPRRGAYKKIVEDGHDLHEIHALIAPRPFFVSAGAEDPPKRWMSLNHTIAVNKILGQENRIGMSNRPAHPMTAETREELALFFEYFLKYAM
ncbi:MAG TPA: alpha/beta hydrolase [Planctomycetota bacterium]|nr:alpha/beta hydrolase [Planctomycetota bacterium]